MRIKIDAFLSKGVYALQNLCNVCLCVGITSISTKEYLLVLNWPLSFSLKLVCMENVCIVNTARVKKKKKETKVRKEKMSSAMLKHTRRWKMEKVITEFKRPLPGR